MNHSRTRLSIGSRSLVALTVAATLALSGIAFAQQGGKPKDDALDDLLKKVEETAKKEAPSSTAKSGDAEKKPAKPGEVAPKDKDLDSLLDKLGQSKDEASPDGAKPPPPPGAGGDDKDKDKGKGSDNKDKKPGEGQGKDSKDQKRDASKSKADNLTGRDKETDEVLDELMGKKKKPKPGDAQKKGQKQGEEEGPLGDLVKQMREVEERLGKPDTGEQTRQKQAEIVKKMDTMIEQMRKMQSRQQAMRMMRQGQQKGQQQGENQDGDLANGPPLQKPEKPKPKNVLALDKNPWGHLPPELRAEMDNIFKEDLLPAKQDLIKRYYLSVSKKSLAREEQ